MIVKRSVLGRLEKREVIQEWKGSDRKVDGDKRVGEIIFTNNISIKYIKDRYQRNGKEI